MFNIKKIKQKNLNQPITITKNLLTKNNKLKNVIFYNNL